jgi:hypothetical protein
MNSLINLSSCGCCLVLDQLGESSKQSHCKILKPDKQRRKRLCSLDNDGATPHYGIWELAGAQFDHS